MPGGIAQMCVQGTGCGTEDDWGQFSASRFSTKNIGRIPRFQELAERYGARPTYLVTYPVATDPSAVELLGAYQNRGRCEVGSHPHPWNTPPVQEARSNYNSFMSNLPGELQYRKLRTLHETITTSFDRAPTCHRSGRWGFSEEVARHLVRLGYVVDTSVSPSMDWSGSGGPDYSGYASESFIYRIDPTPGDEGGTLLEVPATIDFAQAPVFLAKRVYWSLQRDIPLGPKVSVNAGRKLLICGA